MLPANDLRKIVRFCQKNGIVKFKSGDFEIELSGKPQAKPVKEIDSEPAQADFPSWDSLTPEQKLFWSSTPGNGSTNS